MQRFKESSFNICAFQKLRILNFLFQKFKSVRILLLHLLNVQIIFPYFGTVSSSSIKHFSYSELQQIICFKKDCFLMLTT